MNETIIIRCPVALADHFREFIAGLEGACELSAVPLEDCGLEPEDLDGENSLSGELDLQLNPNDNGSVVTLHIFAHPLDAEGRTTDEKLNAFITLGLATGLENETVAINGVPHMLVAVPRVKFRGR